MDIFYQSTLQRLGEGRGKGFEKSFTDVSFDPTGRENVVSNERTSTYFHLRKFGKTIRAFPRDMAFSIIYLQASMSYVGIVHRPRSPSGRANVGAALPRR